MGYTDDIVKKKDLMKEEREYPPKLTHETDVQTRQAVMLDKDESVAINRKEKNWWICSPILLHFNTDDRIVSIACGTDHSLALTERGVVFAWGQGSFGNLGTEFTADV